MIAKLNSDVKFYKMPYGGLKESQENVDFLKSIVTNENVDIVIYQDSYFPCQYLLSSIKDCRSWKIIEVEHNSPSGFEIQYKEYVKSIPCWDIYHRFKSWFYYQKSLSNEKEIVGLYMVFVINM